MKMKTNKVRVTCTEDHIGSVPVKKLADLPESQAVAYRHKCPACAYLAGFKDGQRQLRGKVTRDLELSLGKVLHLHQ
jgi:hypothetical protein